ncbi:MAG TPA: RHS repeat-associated core domain-containing protein [Pirellulales bacterium]|nr:RHS repeat-associated core domain-containing protein [Pirellulales bacterium]
MELGRRAKQDAQSFAGGGNLTARNLAALNPAGVDAVMAKGTVTSLAQGDAAEWMADDALGSPTEVADDNGTVVDRIVRNAVGQIAYESDPSIVIWAGYAGGHVSAATGLVNHDSRWYDPDTGRWTTDDLDGFAGGDTNLSRYVGNDVANGIDPTGEVQLFGQNWVMPWNPNAAGFTDTMAAYASATAMAGTGAASGAAAGAATGAATGAAVGAVGGAIAGAGVGAGPGALAGAGAGAASGAIWGGVTGLWNAAFNSTTLQEAAVNGAKGGAIAGVGAGGIAATAKLTTMAVNAGALPLYHYTTTTAAARISATKLINPPVYATIIPPSVMQMPLVGLLPKLSIGWIGPIQIASASYKPLTASITVTAAGTFIPTRLTFWIWRSFTGVSI